MLQDGLLLADGSSAVNFQIDYGTSLPTFGNNVGELFYLTSGSKGLYVYDGSIWQPSSVGGGGAGGSSFTITGDVTGTIDGAPDVLTLSSVGTAGTFGSSSLIPIVTVDAKGRVTSVTTSSVNGFDPSSNQIITGSWQFSNPIQVAAPTLDAHAATKSYVDSVAAGLDPKASVRAGTVANITLSGLQTVDGVVLVAGDRVLVKNQTTGTQNGLYVAAAGAWIRSTDFDGTPASEVSSGAFTFITEGTVQDNTGWVLTTNDPVTIGTSSLVWAQFSASGTTSLATAATNVAGGSAGNIVYQSAASTTNFITNGTTGQVLTSAGSGTPTWTTLSTVAAGTLTGSTLASNVVASSLTSVGTITAGTWSGLFGAVSGVNLTSLNASNLASGTVSAARLGTGTANSTTFLRGDATWASVASVAGANTQIQYNSGGVLGASSNFTWDNTNFTLVVGPASSASGVVTIGPPDGSGNVDVGSSLVIKASSTTNNFSSSAGNLTLKAGNLGDSGSNGGKNAGGVFIQAGDSAVSTYGPGGGGVVSIAGGAGTAGGTQGYIVLSTSPTTTSIERLRVLNNGAWSVGTGGTATGTAGQVLTSAGNAAPPTWTGLTAGALGGTTLAANVITSSLTSVGTLAALVVTGNVTAAEPTAANHLTTKNYVDTTVQGLTWKTAVKSASTVNMTLSGQQSNDGLALLAGDRVLVKNQTTASQNGIYVVQIGAWTRALDADTAAELDGAAVFIQQGTVNADTSYTENATIVTIGTDTVTWAQFASAGSPAAANLLTGTTLASNVVASSLTSVGTLATLAVTGAATAGSFSGVGTALTALNATNLSSGSVASARLGTGTADATTYLRGDGTWSLMSPTVVAASGNYTVATTTQAVYAGVGADTVPRLILNNGGASAGSRAWGFQNSTLAGLFELRAFNDSISGGPIAMSFARAGAALSSITLTSPTISLVGAVDGTSFSGSGTNLTTLNATNLATGTVAPARLGSGTADATTYLRGDGAWVAVAGSGTVTSVGVSSVNAAITVASSPVTTAGTISITANTFTTTTPGVVPGSGGGTTNFLRADGTWATVAGGTATSLSATAVNPRPSGTTTGVYAGTAGSTQPVITLIAAGLTTANRNTSIWVEPTAGNFRMSFDNDNYSTWLPFFEVTRSGNTATSITLTGTAINLTGAVTGTSFAGVGTLLTALNATNLASGTVAPVRLGTGTADTTTYLRGDGTWSAVAGGGASTSLNATTAASPIITTLGTYIGSSAGRTSITFVHAAALTDQKASNITIPSGTSGTIQFNLVNDAINNEVTWMSVARSAQTATSITLTGTAINLTGAVTGTSFAGVGTALTALNATNLAPGTGAVTLTTAIPGATGSSGAMSILTGIGGSTSGTSGSITIRSGSTTSGATGALSAGSGNATAGASGDITLTTGSASTTSGTLTLGAGAATTTSGQIFFNLNGTRAATLWKDGRFQVGNGTTDNNCNMFSNVPAAGTLNGRYRQLYIGHNDQLQKNLNYQVGPANATTTGDNTHYLTFGSNNSEPAVSAWNPINIQAYTLTNAGGSWATRDMLRLDPGCASTNATASGATGFAVMVNKIVNSNNAAFQVAGGSELVGTTVITSSQPAVNTAPSGALLEVRGGNGDINNGGVTQLQVRSTTANVSRMHLQNSTTGFASNNGFLIQLDANGLDTVFYNYSAGNMRFGTSGTERLRILADGTMNTISAQFGVGPSTATLPPITSGVRLVVYSASNSGVTVLPAFAAYSSNQAAYLGISYNGINVVNTTGPNTLPLSLCVEGTESVRFTPVGSANAGAWGIGGANFGSAGQALISQGGAAAPIWGFTPTVSAATAQITGTTSVTITTPIVNLSSAGSMIIVGTTASTAPPATTTRSIGTRVVVYPALSGTEVDFAMGVESGNLWTSIPAAFPHKWYQGTVNTMTLSTAGVLSGRFDSATAGSIGPAVAVSGVAGLLSFSNNSVAGVGAPTFSTRSAGTKVVLYPNISASAVDYAIGIESNTLWQSVPTSANLFKWYAGTQQILQLGATALLPSPTNTLSLGGASNLWTQLYAASATINTSDRNYKTEIADIDAAELLVSRALKPLMKKFKYKDAVDEKGSANARIHFGVIAQDVQDAFEAHGLDASNYGLFCSDTWYELDGAVVDAAIEGAVAKTRLGIRYEELLAFIIIGL